MVNKKLGVVVVFALGIAVGSLVFAGAGWWFVIPAACAGCVMALVHK